MWRFDGAEWHAIPFQVDERNAAGKYTTSEDGRLDSNDELVILAVDLGVQARVGTRPVEVGEPIQEAMVVVRDPLQPGELGWAYVYRSQTAPVAFQPLARYDRPSRQLIARSYVLGLSETFVGIERLHINSSQVDILDRSKLRVRIAPPGPFPPTTHTEEDAMLIAEVGTLNLQPVINGPLRVVMSEDGDGFAYPEYIDGLPALFAQLKPPPGVPAEFVDEIRLSLDFSEAALPARYSDSNLAQAVAVDGLRDQVPLSPVPTWRQVDTPMGSVVTVAHESAQLGAHVQSYYLDQSPSPQGDTGDGRSFGDNGVVQLEGADVRVGLRFLNTVAIVPPDAGTMGPTVMQQLRAPLQVAVLYAEQIPTLTPGSSVTPGPTDTSTPVVVSTATPTVSARAFLPRVVAARETAPISIPHRRSAASLRLRKCLRP
jgi:hypothetical protein